MPGRALRNPRIPQLGLQLEKALDNGLRNLPLTTSVQQRDQWI
jgi:hypothetical protein